MNTSGGDREFPGDLALVLLMTLLTVVISVTPVLSDSLVRVPIGIVFLFIVPGYALTAVLFPRAAETTKHDDEVYLGSVDRNFTILERTAVSIGLSIAVVSLLTLLINTSPWSLSLGSILISVGGFVVVTTAVAARRRRRLPPGDRLQMISRSQLDSVRDALWGSRADRLVNVILVISVVLMSMSIAYAAAVPRDDQRFTRFYILSENGQGELTTDDYPVDLAADENGQVVVGVENHEHERFHYSVVILLERISRDGDSVTVVSKERLTSFDVELEHGETERQQVTFSPLSPDDEHRVSFLLFRAGVPDEPNSDNSYRNLHLLVNRDNNGTSVSL